MIDRYNFNKTKYGTHLLIDLVRIESLEGYVNVKKPFFSTFYNILLIKKGTAEIIIDNKKSKVDKNSIVSFSPMQICEWKMKNMPKGLYLIFEEEFLSTYFKDTDFVKKLTLFQANSPNQVIQLTDSDAKYLENLFLKVEKEILNRNIKNIHFLRALLYQILAWLDEEYINQKLNDAPISKNDMVIRFEKLVDEYYSKEHSVSFYAKKMNISSGYLNDINKKNNNISAKQYITNRIFLEAKRFLNYSSLSVSEIAWKLSFKDESYFIRAFKKFSGYTPKNYRNLKHT